MMRETQYTYDAHGNMLRMLNISDNEKVFVRMDSETIRYLYDNHLGSACLELDEYGYIISYEEYHPFGTTSYRAGRSATEVSWKRYKYCGKERDEETGLYYYGARYYAAWLGRFVSCDPLQHEQPGKTPFHYCSNNPINRVDPTGMQDDEPPKSKDDKFKGFQGGRGTPENPIELPETIISGKEKPEDSPKFDTRLKVSFRLNSGIIGAVLKFAGFPIKLMVSLGGGEQEISAYADFSPSTVSNTVISHTQRTIKEGMNSISLGPLSFSEREIKETTRDLSSRDGATKQMDKEFHPETSLGYKNMNIGENRIDFFSMDFGALFIGIGISISIETVPAKSKTEEKNPVNKENPNMLTDTINAVPIMNPIKHKFTPLKK